MKNQVMIQDSDAIPRLCTCRDCGKEFRYGDEGDNEKFCLRCEAIFMIKVDNEYDDGDCPYMEEESQYHL